MASLNNLFRNDENLLRLLWYKSKSYDDDIFQITTERPRITVPWTTDHKLDTTVPWVESVEDPGKMAEIIDSIIISTMKYTDLTTTPTQKCRLCFSLGNRGNTNNPRLAYQEMVFNIYVHTEIDKVDYRLAKICDYLTRLIAKNNRIIGTDKVVERLARPFSINSDEYIGYQFVYEFGSTKP